MNDCEYAFRLGAYHDGELPAPAAAELEQHLQRCPACAAELAALRSLSEILGSAVAAELSAEAMQRLHRSVERTTEVGILRMAEALVGMAAAILIACTISLVASPSSAGTNGTVTPWEMAAVSQVEDDSEASTVEQQIAKWAVEDLARKNGHD